MEFIQSINDAINNIVWGPPMLVLLLATGAFLTVGLKFFPWKSLNQAIALITRNEKQTAGIAPRAALFTALANTIGTGNIGGVATAIIAGGPGAVFYMWLTAVFGMATKYAEAFCAVRFRQTDEDGFPIGGPMYYLSLGLSNMGPFRASLGKFLALCFAIFGIITAYIVGNAIQSNSIAAVLESELNISPLYSGIFIAIVVGLVVLGGIKRIAEVADKLVPAMTIIYIIGGTVVLMIFARNIPAAIASIFAGAFTPRAAFGGSVYLAIRYGLARGAFSNEAGLGSAAIAHGASATKDPLQQGQIAILGVGIDTLLVCSFTALVILSSGQVGSGLNGASLTSASFARAFPSAQYIVVLSLILFAFTTIVSSSYYGECCLNYLCGKRRNLNLLHRILFVLTVFAGADLELELIWALADTFNGLMAVPNLTGLLLLSPIIFKESLKRIKNGLGELQT